MAEDERIMAAACDMCGEEFRNKRGRNIHETMKHGETAELQRLAAEA